MKETENFLEGGGEMARLIAGMDWSATALGPIESWPQSLKTTVSLCLSSTFPILIAWGPETIQIYNDSYRPICGDLHPASMGQNFRICWETALPVVGDAFTRGQEGQGTYIKDQRIFLDRKGYLEEAFMTFSFSPIRNEQGEVGGIFHPITETTDKMLASRRSQSLRDLMAVTGKAKTVQDIYAAAIASGETIALDIPFLLIYRFKDDGLTAVLESWAGIDSNNPLAVGEIDFSSDTSSGTGGWPIKETLSSHAYLLVNNLANLFGSFECGPYEEPPHMAIVLPVQLSGSERPWGFIIAGVSACRAIDQEYLNFYDLMRNAYNVAFSNVYAYEQEQKRVEELAAIDRSKTAFFSNVSHEFRTPLTLMMGPLEDLMRYPLLQESMYKGNLDSTYRNAQRLLKLVNNLLDFSRTEADRLRIQFQSVDLAELTTDLASSFRSIIERAGMELRVRCHLPEKVYVDKSVWEKIVLNLLSNAFKFTLQGSIGINLYGDGKDAILEVSDTGVGIPAEELPHMFERFHRVEKSEGRTHEGSGIGLSLVNELVKLHHGTIYLRSEEGKGTVFTVKVPLGQSHLDPAWISEGVSDAASSFLKGAFLQEASALLEEDKAGNTLSSSAVVEEDRLSGGRATVLVVDDNIDMRNYLSRILEPEFIIQTAKNGLDALNSLKIDQPDLIISDIMMPVMDGKALLEAVRTEASTARIPLIFLSARAGNEARIDGLEAGADDYLVKPFSAKELLVKVRSNINLTRSRSLLERQLKSLFSQAPVAIGIFRGPGLIVEMANEILLEYLGLPWSLVTGRPLASLPAKLLTPEIVQEVRTVLETGNGYITQELTLLHRNEELGQELVLQLAFEPLKEEDNTVFGVMCMAYDVTPHVQARDLARGQSVILEKNVQLRTAELSRSNSELKKANAELAEFYYISSHDLQEPLRKIQVYGSIIKEQLEKGGGVIQYLTKMTQSAARMSKLIRDLLHYSRLNNGTNDKLSVDLNLLLAEVVNDFELVIKERAATVSIGSLPTIMAIPVQVNQLFYNLLGNALKFSKDRPVIKIAGRQLSEKERDAIDQLDPRKDYVEITVEDNGIGFDQRYASQIFTVFKRLVRQDEYAGTGIGLTICRKVMENHSGFINPVSAPQKGTTFYLFFPVV